MAGPFKSEPFWPGPISPRAKRASPSVNRASPFSPVSAFLPNPIHFLSRSGLSSDALRREDIPPLRVYCGFDPTAESLHLGNLLALIVLSWFIRCGHQAVALVGGATGRVGDPSGKSLERSELDPLSLDRNISAISASIQSILGRVVSPSGSSFVAILNNYEWWKDVKLLDFLKDVGRYARVWSPNMYNMQLWETSGHAANYKENIPVSGPFSPRTARVRVRSSL
ncbi:hypothetical protein ACS0TY_005656 [Phlomoides rotata]